MPPTGAGRHLPAGQLRAPSKRSGAWMSALRCRTATGPGQPGAAAGDPEQQQLRQGRARAAPRCCRWTTRARCSTSSATACTGCCRRHLRAAVGHPGAARLRRAAVADLRALDHRARGAAAPRAPLADRRADPGRADAAPAGARAASTRATRPCATPPARWSTWPCTALPTPSRRPTCAPSRPSCCSGSACRRRGLNHRLVHFQHLFGRFRLCRGLLRVPVGRGAGRRRLRGLHRGRQPLRPGGGGAPEAHIYSSGNSVEPARGLRCAFRGRAGHGAAAAEEARAARRLA
jgi:hypothetical protein